MTIENYVKQLAQASNINIVYDYNPSRSCYEPAIGTKFFRSLEEVRDFLTDILR